MRRFLVLGVLVLSASAASGDPAADSCPPLPEESDLEWELVVGVDFNVCLAHLGDRNETVLGIYLGNHPTLHSGHSPVDATSRVAGVLAQWHTMSVENSEAIGLQAIVELPGGSPGMQFVHVWVTGSSGPSLDERLALVATLDFSGPEL